MAKITLDEFNNIYFALRKIANALQSKTNATIINHWSIISKLQALFDSEIKSIAKSTNYPDEHKYRLYITELRNSQLEQIQALEERQYQELRLLIFAMRDTKAMLEDWTKMRDVILAHQTTTLPYGKKVPVFVKQPDGALCHIQGNSSDIDKLNGMSMQPSEYHAAIKHACSKIIINHLNTKHGLPKDPAPNGVFFSQVTVSSRFSDSITANMLHINKKLILDVAQTIATSHNRRDVKPDDLRVSYFIRDGRKIVTNNRSLAALQQAGIATPPRMLPVMMFSDAEKRMKALNERPSEEVRLEGFNTKIRRLQR